MNFINPLLNQQNIHSWRCLKETGQLQAKIFLNWANDQEGIEHRRRGVDFRVGCRTGVSSMGGDKSLPNGDAVYCKRLPVETSQILCERGDIFEWLKNIGVLVQLCATSLPISHNRSCKRTNFNLATIQYSFIQKFAPFKGEGWYGANRIVLLRPGSLINRVKNFV